MPTPDFVGVLETALYRDTADRDAVERFYRELLGLPAVEGWQDGVAFRIGGGVLLLFDRGQLAQRAGPIADHATSDAGHACLQARRDDYVAVQQMLDPAHPWGIGDYSKSDCVPDLTDEAIDALVDKMREARSPFTGVHLCSIGGAAARVDRDTMALEPPPARWFYMHWAVAAPAVALGVLLLVPAGGSIGEGGPAVPAGGMTLDGAIAQTFARMPAPVGRWTHVALTYDGARQRLYVNGRMVGSRAAAGRIQTPGTPVWIGGNSPYGDTSTGCSTTYAYTTARSPRARSGATCARR